MTIQNLKIGMFLGSIAAVLALGFQNCAPNSLKPSAESYADLSSSWQIDSNGCQQDSQTCTLLISAEPITSSSKTRSKRPTGNDKYPSVEYDFAANKLTGLVAPAYFVFEDDGATRNCLYAAQTDELHYEYSCSK